MRLSVSFLLLALVLSPISAQAESQIGVTVDAKTRVIKSGVGGQQVVAVATPVYLNDRLRADSTGLAQIRFIDDTKIVVGPNSNITLDDFVFSSSTTAKVVTVSISKGAFRWISGGSGSKAYNIKTPGGSIGVRGTAFDVTILGNKTNVLLLQGQVTICPRGSACKSVRDRCEYVSFDRRGILKQENFLKTGNVDKYGRVFPLIDRQERLNQRFRRESSGCKGYASTTTVIQTRTIIAAPPPPPPPPPDPPSDPGNPGNGKPVGKAGPDPNGKGFGGPTRGRGDTNGKRNGLISTTTSATATSASGTSGTSSTGGGSGGGGHGNGHGGGNGNGNGNGHGGGNGNGNR